MVDFKQLEALDKSFAVNAPRTVDVPKALKVFLGQSKNALIEYQKMDVDTARKIASSLVANHLEWHLVESDDAAVWNALLKPLEEDVIRVVGLFHGHVPDTVRSRIPVIDVGDSLATRTSKKAVLELSKAIAENRSLTSGGWELHNALTELCYEVLYKPADAVFSKKTISEVPVYLAKSFFNVKAPRSGWSDSEALNRVNMFLQEVRTFRVNVIG